MIRIVKTTLFFALLAIPFAASAAPVPVYPGVPFALGPGQSAEVVGTDLSFIFTEILSDSRCPSGVVCVWEGDAEAAVVGDLPGEIRIDCVLHTSPMFSGSCDMGAFRVTLLWVDPYPVAGFPIDPANYVAHFLIVESGSVDVDKTVWGSVKALYYRADD